MPRSSRQIWCSIRAFTSCSAILSCGCRSASQTQQDSEDFLNINGVIAKNIVETNAEFCLEALVSIDLATRSVKKLVVELLAMVVCVYVQLQLTMCLTIFSSLR